MSKVLISIATVPTRMCSSLLSVLNSLSGIQQDVLVNIPRKYKKWPTFRIPDIHCTLGNYFPNLNINILEKDYGPANKLLGALEWIERNEKTGYDHILTLDDDQYYSDWPGFLKYILDTYNLHPGCVITIGGIRLTHYPYRYKNGLAYDNVGYVDAVNGGRGVLYPRICFGRSEFYTLLPDMPIGIFNDDDAYFGIVLSKIGIPIYAINRFENVKNEVRLIHCDQALISAVQAEENKSRVDNEMEIFQFAVEHNYLPNKNNVQKKSEFVLSIIIPLHNTSYECGRLLETLSLINQNDIEVIFVNDGSTDDTQIILEKFIDKNPNKFSLFAQENCGAGHARNFALGRAKGKYIWFVDSDDNISLKAIDVLRDKFHNDYDFFDFNYYYSGEVVNTLNLGEGEYTNESWVSSYLAMNFPRNGVFQCSKFIKRKILVEHSLLFPEYCYYEDNAIGLFFQNYFKTFYKSEIVAYHYIHNINSSSSEITKGFNYRYLGRLYAAYYGFQRYLIANPKYNESLVECSFIKLFLLSTIEQGNFFSIKNLNCCVLTIRMMRLYRSVANKFKIKSTPFRQLIGGKYAHKFVIMFCIYWLIGYLLPRQEKWFDAKHREAWETPINSNYKGVKFWN